MCSFFALCFIVICVGSSLATSSALSTDGHSCGVNETLASCKFDCPTEFCPVNGSYLRAVCDAPRQCPEGCVCKHKYVWRSKEDRTCILAEECPKLPCTGPHEEWDKCPSPCFPELCNTRNLSPKQCSTINKEQVECEPRCSCKDSYKRHADSLLCIPGEDCPE